LPPDIILFVHTHTYKERKRAAEKAEKEEEKIESNPSFSPVADIKDLSESEA
jgi:hypothetical protein